MKRVLEEYGLVIIAAIVTLLFFTIASNFEGFPERKWDDYKAAIEQKAKERTVLFLNADGTEYTRLTVQIGTDIKPQLPQLPSGTPKWHKAIKNGKKYILDKDWNGSYIVNDAMVFMNNPILNEWNFGATNPEEVKVTLYTNGVLEFTGKGNTKTVFFNSPNPWAVNYSEHITSTAIDPGIRSNNMDAWYRACRNLGNVNIIIPETVKSAKYTFGGCKKLSGTVTIMDNIDSYSGMFGQGCATEGSGLIVNYSKNCKNIDKILATADKNANITKGVCIDE